MATDGTPSIGQIWLMYERKDSIAGPPARVARPRPAPAPAPLPVRSGSPRALSECSPVLHSAKPCLRRVGPSWDFRCMRPGTLKGLPNDATDVGRLASTLASFAGTSLDAAIAADNTRQFLALYARAPGMDRRRDRTAQTRWTQMVAPQGVPPGRHEDSSTLRTRSRRGVSAPPLLKWVVGHAIKFSKK